MSENERAPQSPTWTTRFHGGVGGEHSETSAWAHTVLRFALACHTQKLHLNTWKTSYVHLCRSKPTRRIVRCFNPLAYACFKKMHKTYGNINISTFPSRHQPALTSEQSPA